MSARTCLILCTWLLAVSATVAADGIYLAVGYGGRRMTSRDGQMWENVQQWADVGKDDANNLMSATFFKGKFVVVGGGGFSKETQAGHILVSTNGRDWHEAAKYPFRVNPVVTDGQRLVAGGPARQLLWSDDAEQWHEGEKVNLPPEIPGWAFWFRGGAARVGHHVFYGNAGKEQKTWWCVTSREGEKIESFATNLPPVRGIATGANKFVLASAEALFSSPDGQKWERTAGAPADEFRNLVWNGTAFIVAGKQGMYSSADGVVWKPAGRAPPGNLVWGDAHGFIATSWPGKMSFSTDGQNWKSTGQPPPGLGVNHIVFGVPLAK